mgnify:CR=1 FL=1
MVALFHFAAISHISASSLIKNAYLFVDFFFVLSGFVIATNYRSRLAQGFGFGRFMLLRFGRIYPLHFAMLLLFIPIDIAKDGIGPNLWRAVVTNALLLHALGVNDALWLNFPSWSISAEFAAYLVFAIVVVRLGKGYLPWLLPIAACPLILGLISPNGMDSTYDYGFVRCLYGFALGVICFDLRERLPGLCRPLGVAADTLIEVAASLAVFVFLGMAIGSHSWTVISPVLFSVLVLVFARQGGVASRWLTTRPLLLIGTFSYSIYMVHALVRALVRAGAMALEHASGWRLFFDSGVNASGEPIRLLWVAGSLWLGDLLQIVMLLTTIGVAMLTWRYIEEPGRLWSRRLVSQSSRTVPVASDLVR